jgi:hypothetical protein
MKEKKARKTLQLRDVRPTQDVRGGNRRHRGGSGHAFGSNQQEDRRQALRNINGIFMQPV